MLSSFTFPSTTTKGGSSGESREPSTGVSSTIWLFGTGGAYSTVTESSISTPSGPEATTRTRFKPGDSATDAAKLLPSTVTGCGLPFT